MSTDREAFEQTLRADPYDQATRLVFADWLDEHDCPEDADWQRAWTPEWQQAWDRTRAFCEEVNLNHTYFLEEARKVLAGEQEDMDVTINTSNATLDWQQDYPGLWDDVSRVLKLSVWKPPEFDPFTCGDNCFAGGLDWGDDERE